MAMLAVAQLVIMGVVLVGLGAILISRVSARWLVRTAFLWLFAPFILMVAVLVPTLLLASGRENALSEAFFAFMLIGTIVLVPWLLVSGVGIAIGFALRRRRVPALPVATRPSETIREALPKLASVQETPAPLPQRIVDDRITPHFSHTSPDGSIRIEIQPFEWTNGLFINTPRVTEASGGRVLCDLLETDWEAHTAFPRERYVWLGLRRYRSPGHLFAECDLDAGRYRIALESLEVPDEEGPLGDITDRLEHWWVRATALAASRPNKEEPGRGPGPFDAFRTALVILVGAIAAIAGLTYLSVTYGIDPPRLPSSIPAIPRVPH